MRLIPFPTNIAYPGAWEISIPIRVRPAAAPTFTLNAIVDTGAENTYFEKTVARRIGIADITTGLPNPVHTADERTADGFIHDVEIEIFGRVLTIPVTFVPSWPRGTDNLLGMEGLFDSFIFGIDHRIKTLYAKAN